MRTYTPEPLDTSAVEIPEDLSELLERLAKNTHDVWAAQRIQDGWRFGEQRNDASKEHPCLVPYEDLPESEKEYDRAIVSETVKVIISLQYNIKNESK